MNIHGQHEHQLLLKEDHQIELLDNYARHTDLLSAVAAQYRQWFDLEKEYKHAIQQQDELEAQRQLLQYQVEELNDFAIAEGEFEELELRHKKLSHSKYLMEASAFSPVRYTRASTTMQQGWSLQRINDWKKRRISMST